MKRRMNILQIAVILVVSTGFGDDYFLFIYFIFFFWGGGGVGGGGWGVWSLSLCTQLAE